VKKKSLVKRFELPSAPADQIGPVKAWSGPVVIPTYRPMPPDKNLMFLDGWRFLHWLRSGSVPSLKIFT
jgi:hypothetical protein